MKFTFVLFFFYLVAANAVSLVAKISIDKIKVEMTQNYKQVADRLKHDIEQIFLKRILLVKSAVRSVEVLRKTNNTCVVAESEKFLSILESFTNSIQNCSDEATKNSKKILADINAFSQQLERDSQDLIRIYQECPNRTGIVSKMNCYRGWESLVTEYKKSFRKSFKEVKHSTDVRRDYVLIKADSCSKNPFEDCIYDLAYIYRTINNCIIRPT